MVVAMVIVMVILLLGAGTLILARDQETAKDAAETIRSDIRRAQIKAISTEGSCTNSANPKPKMWGIEFTPANDTYSLKYFCSSDTPQWKSSTKTEDNVNLRTRNIDISFNGSQTASPVSLVFNSPFNEFFMVNGTLSGGAAQGDFYGTYKPTNVYSFSELNFGVSYKAKTNTVQINRITGIGEVR